MCFFSDWYFVFLKKVLSTFSRSEKFKILYSCVQSFEFIRSAKGHRLNIQKHEILQKIRKFACDLGFAATNCSCQKMSKINSDICWGAGLAADGWLTSAVFLFFAFGVYNIFIFCVWRLQYFYFLRLQYYYCLCRFCSIYNFLILQY